MAERISKEFVVAKFDNLLVLQNPTRERTREMIRAVHGDLRMLRNVQTREMYIWDYAKAAHVEVAEALGLFLNDFRREYVTDGPGSSAKYVDLKDAPTGWFAGDA